MRAVFLLPLLAPLCLPMNTSAEDKKPDLDKLLEKKVFEKGKSKLPYRVMKPEGYKKDAKDVYPLVVFLHGAGERGDDNAAQLKHGVADFAREDRRKKHPCFLIAPQCPKNQFWNGDLVLALIDAVAKEFPVDKKRIYVTGLSMGGYATWDLLGRKPDLFAAAIPICGGGDVKKAEKFAKVSIWCFHGDKDGAVKVESSRSMIKALEKASGKPKYTEYEGVGHDSWTRTYSDEKVHEWLFAQKKE
jgi:predicted peptidase